MIINSDKNWKQGRQKERKREKVAIFYLFHSLGETLVDMFTSANNTYVTAKTASKFEMDEIF